MQRKHFAENKKSHVLMIFFKESNWSVQGVLINFYLLQEP